jgi:hypothetical protein
MKTLKIRAIGGGLGAVLAVGAIVIAMAPGAQAFQERKDEERRNAPAKSQNGGGQRQQENHSQRQQQENRGASPQQSREAPRAPQNGGGQRFGTNNNNGAARGPQNERQNERPNAQAPRYQNSGVNHNGAPNNAAPGANRPVNPGGGYRPGPAANNHPGGGGYNSFRSNGPSRPMVVHTGNATVFHGPSGEQRIVHTMPGGRTVVANAGGHGYVQRSVTVHNSVFVQRTYYVGGRPMAHFYRPYVYRGVSFHVYAPMHFWTPRFYAYAYNPWARPISYNWGWGGRPWFGFYAGYFTPYPTYAGPAFWLTDYLLASSLQEAYQERMDAAAAAGAYASAPPPPPPGPDAVATNGQVVLTPEVKQAIADEVRMELQQEQQQSATAQTEPVQAVPQPQGAPPAQAIPANTPPPALSPNTQHVFIVSSVVVVNSNGQQCAVTQGDVLQLDAMPSYSDPTNARVLASKSSDCPSGRAVEVGLSDLQEMQNHMRETLDQGLTDMQSKQGQGNLPVIDASMRTQVPAPYAADMPAPDPNAASDLQQTAQTAVQPQAGMAPATVPQQPAPTGGSTIAMGQTINQVVAIMGQPVTKFEGAQKTIYVYKNLKITFTGGKVSDVQ